MSFQEIAKSVRAEAESRGLRQTMSRLNDAIALACYGKKYAAVVAAEKAGRLGPMASPPPHIAAAARRYKLDEHAFGLALHNGIDGRESPGNEGTVNMAMGWLLAQHNSEVLRLEEVELRSLADRALVDRVLASEYETAAVYGFAEWVIAEGAVKANGRSYSVAELLLGGSSRPAWNARQRAYLRALVNSPLRLYLIEEVVAGYHLVLRPIGDHEPRLIEVTERSGSEPGMVGQMLGARVIAHNGRLELAGGIFMFTLVAGMRLAEAVRNTTGAAAVSRLIRKAWFEQFDLPPPQYVVGASHDPMRFVTDTYRCPSLDALATRLAGDSRVQGDAELGWGLVVRDTDGRDRTVCSISPSDEVADVVSVFYQSIRRAETYRPWFEALAGDAAGFMERESIDPMEAAMAAGDDRRKEPQLPPDVMTMVLAQAIEQMYADFADHPVPVLDGATPRQMLQRPGGEARVRELLATYESNERQMAQRDKREPVDFGFLYRKLGLSAARPPVDSRSPGLHPDQFDANEAWIVFRLIDEPMETKDAGRVDVLGLMDAGSTCILNFTMRKIGADLTEIEAMAFFQHLKVAAPPRPPRRLYVAADVHSDHLCAEAARRGLTVITTDPDGLDGIVGWARESIGAKLAARLRNH